MTKRGDQSLEKEAFWKLAVDGSRSGRTAAMRSSARRRASILTTAARATCCSDFICSLRILAKFGQTWSVGYDNLVTRFEPVFLHDFTRATRQIVRIG